MDLSNLALFKVLSKRMDYLSQRQEVIAQNIANADTPHFRPRDLAPFEFRTALAQAHQLAPARTDAAHLEPVRASRSPLRPEHERRPYETKPDGNAVVVEEQMLKLNQTAADHGMITNLYRKQVGLLKAAFGRGV